MKLVIFVGEKGMACPSSRTKDQTISAAEKLQRQKMIWIEQVNPIDSIGARAKGR